VENSNRVITDNKRRRGLGRGLDALFNDVKIEEEGFAASRSLAVNAAKVESFHSMDVEQIKPSTAQNATRKVAIEKLHPGKFQPRHNFKDEALNNLADSIRTHGVLQPLLVRASENGDYEIIAGERRWRAAQLAQVHELPIIVLELDDNKVLEIALIENLQREDLSPLEEAQGYQRLIEEFQYTQDDLAKQLGKSRSLVTNTLRLLKLSELVKSYIDNGSLSAGHARALVGCDKADEIAKVIIKRGLSVRQTEKLVKGSTEGKTIKNQSGTKTPRFVKKDVDILALEEKMTSLLGMKFGIISRGEEGSINIEYKTLEQLDDLLEKLSRLKAA